MLNLYKHFTENHTESLRKACTVWFKSNLCWLISVPLSWTEVWLWLIPTRVDTKSTKPCGLWADHEDIAFCLLWYRMPRMESRLATEVQWDLTSAGFHNQVPKSFDVDNSSFNIQLILCMACFFSLCLKSLRLMIPTYAKKVAEILPWQLKNLHTFVS